MGIRRKNASQVLGRKLEFSQLITKDDIVILRLNGYLTKK
jgi:hypothetical protein